MDRIDTQFSIPCDDLEIDKVPGAWVLTYWLADDVTLRLKIRHSSSMEPDDFVAEVRLRPDAEFVAVHEFMMSVYEIAHPDEFPSVWSELPPIWRCQFKAMARKWATLTYVAEFGNTGPQRYAGEPNSSRDYFEADSRWWTTVLNRWDSRVRARGHLQNQLNALIDRPGRARIARWFAAHLAVEFPAVFTFLLEPDATNWRAEQALRRAVVTRRVCGGNRTTRGAHTHEVLARVLRMIQQRQLNASVIFSDLLRAPKPITAL